ncbi:hypothetical protein BDV23DRAFT_189345 [Aspergillus alliaceus]|uniref:Uncharacterized protein n=1 Tax=Petromyces alliaceus TaxID=209559 RepID=A0A5N7BR44_PETAA|nr:hypothetical protein BDV23DRAFT_189345 [Aspergillus alliaceus]
MTPYRQWVYNHVLSDPEIALLLSEVFPRALHTANLAGQLEDHLRSTRSLQAAIEAVCCKHNVPAHDKNRLELVLSLFALSDGSLPVVAFCFHQPQLEGTSPRANDVRELAWRVITIPAASKSIPTGSERDWLRLRERLFAEEATSVLCGLITSDVISVDEHYKGLVVSILQLAVEKYAFNIAKEPFQELLPTNRAQGDAYRKRGGATFPAINLLEEAQVPKEARQPVREFLLMLQRLQALVSEPEDIGDLVKCGYKSAEGIADLGEIAVQTIVDHGVPQERARRILNHASTIASRSEGLRMAALKARGTGSSMDVSLAAIDPPRDSTDEINLTTMFGMASMGCEDCASVTGPAAFFVDLLYALKLKQTSTPPYNASTDTLLDRLLKRRADLEYLELSCANTNVLVPYVDLVNEVLESVICNINDVTQIRPCNANEEDTTDRNLVQPWNINFKVYKTIIQPVVSPMHVFPYNQAIQSIRSYLTALGVSRFELLSNFHSPYSITAKQDMVPHVRDVLNHALAAEALNLQHEDYAAITRRGFYPMWLMEKLLNRQIAPDEYEAIIGLKEKCQYWGYANDDDMTSDETGLTKIQNQLLPRSGLTFQDLLTVLKTKFLNGKLGIDVGKSPDPLRDPFLLEKMTLHEWGDQGKSGPLTSPTCERLQAFLRLRIKLQWPTEELDAVIVALAPSSSGGMVTIDTSVLDNLAAVKQLTEFVKLSPTELQPLWGKMNTHGDRSLYGRLFLSAALSKDERSAFMPDKNGELPSGKPMTQFLHTVLMSLAMSDAEYQAIKRYVSDDLTLENISQLYRILTLCKILSVPPLAYSDLLTLLPKAYKDPFKDPQTTLALVKQYPSIQPISRHWTLERLLFVINRTPSTTDEKCNPTIESCIETTDALRSNLDNTVLKSMQKKIADDNTLPSFLHQIITDKVDRENILHFIQMAPSNSDSFIKQISRILGEDVATELHDKIALLKSKKDRQDAFLNALLPATIYRTSLCQAVLKSLRSYFPDLSMALLRLSLEELIKINGKISGMDVLLQLIQNPSPQGKGCSAYIRPPTTDTYKIVGYNTEKLTGSIDGAPLQFQETDDQSVWVAITRPLTGGHWYKLDYSGQVSDLTWTVNQVAGVKPAAFDRTNLLEECIIKSTGPVFIELMRVSILVGSFRLHNLEVEFGPVLRDLIGSSHPRFDFNQLCLQDICDLERYLQLRDEFSQNGAKLPLLDLYKWLFSCSKNSKMDDIRSQLRIKLADATGWVNNICEDFLDAKYPNCDQSTLVQSFQDISTLWQMREAVGFVRDLGLPSLSLRSLFLMAHPALTDLVEMDFKYAASLRLAIQSKRFPSGSEGGKGTLAKASDEIRSSQREALVFFLLSSQYAEENHLTTADDLFGHFLIDMKMGPGLQTSRLKQAISSVQVFAQRCALGLEKDIDQTVLGRSDLEYMLRYRLWEADRKAYLYPENWADPTLRDNKSEQFQAAESKIMQTKLDSEAITTIIKDYIDDVDEIANLRVESYVIEKVKDPLGPTLCDIIHLFGRTRTSPPTFYYRKVSWSWSRTKEPPKWTAWSKINVEIPVQETDADGQKLPRPGSYLLPAVYQGRLYVFLPEIVLGQDPNPGTLNSTYSDLLHSKDRICKQQSIRRWEVRMGFIELRNGKWSPKRICRSVINVPGPMPDISNFKFWIQQGGPPDVLTVMVEGLSGKDLLGQFKMRDQQLILVDKDLPVPKLDSSPMLSSALDDPAAITTTFVRYRGEEHPADPPKIHHNGHEYNLALGGEDKNMPDLGSTRHYEWIMDFNYDVKNSALGMVFEVSATDTDSTNTGKLISIKQYIDLAMNHGYLVQRLFNGFSPQLVTATRYEDGLGHTFDCLNKMAQTKDGHEDYASHKDAFGRWTEPPNYELPSYQHESNTEPQKHYHECSSPFALYNWELGVHLPSLFMERLMATQQFDLALTVARLVFDPSMDGTGINRCWSFPPFREDIVRTGDPVVDSIEWQESNGNVHAAARAHPVAYMKRFAMKYIELLLAMGDEHFRQDTLESIPLAIQMYTEASHVFGPQPAELPQLGKRAVTTYNQIKGQITNPLDLSDVMVDMELDFPFYTEPGRRGMRSRQPRRPFSCVKTGYFCVPGNSYPISLRSAIDDRLYKIRNGMDINGNQRVLPLFEPPIDPGALVRAKAPGGIGIAGFLADLESPMPRYRFCYLIQRAYELVNELKHFGLQMLSIKEKKDAEALAMLRSQHRNTVLALVMRIKGYQKTEVQRSIESLEEARSQQEMRLKYYLALTGDTREVPQKGGSWQDIPQSIEKPKMDEFRMSPFEQEDMRKADEASDLNFDAGAIESAAAAAFAFPMIGMKLQPMGLGGDTSLGGQTVGQVLLCSANVLRGKAQRALDDGAKAVRKATATRQLQERRLEANTIGRELVKIDKDLNQLQSRLDTCEAEIATQKQGIDNAATEEEWLRTKYTSQELYTLLENSMGTLFYQTYQMAMDMTKTAKRALGFELVLQSQNGAALDKTSGGYWENSRDGQLSGEALFLELKRIENIYMENRTHEFEILKTVSLRQIDPWALLTLQETGAADFNISEALFDLDYPGHYCRRISSVAVSLPCIVGPYTSLGCTLTLQQHKYRISPTAESCDDYVKQSEAGFRTDRIPITSIAVSSGVQDTGTVDLNFRGNELYGPFEGAGAISTWHIGLPSKHRQFDYNSIADVVLHLRYTDFGSGGLLGQYASGAVDQIYSKPSDSSYGKGVNMIAVDLKNDYPSEWNQISSTGSMVLPTLEGRLPFWIRNQASDKLTVKSNKIDLLVYPKLANAPIVKVDDSNTIIKLDDQSDWYSYDRRANSTSQIELTGSWEIQGIKVNENAELKQGWLIVEYNIS